MTALVVSIAGGYGMFLLFTRAIFGWDGLGPGPRVTRRNRLHSQSAREWLTQAGLDEVPVGEFAGVVTAVALAGLITGALLFGSVAPAMALGGFAGSLPIATYRQRRAARRAKAQERWPRMIEEIRLLTGAAGRSVPQALFEVGLAGPAELRPSFEAAHREWLISTDFSRTVAVLKARLADATADAACETLLVAHEVGGSDLDRRLTALADDRRKDTQYRKDSRSKQAGVRFARRFTLIVPLGMALAGMSVGNGRDAYQTPAGQAAVVLAVALMVGCWLWAGRIMALPEADRVFDR